MRPLAVGCGALLVLAAACFGLTWLATLTLPEVGADNAVLVGSLAIMAGVMGGTLAYAGARGGLHGARRHFGAKGPLPWMALFLAVLVGGSLVVATGPGPTTLLLPPLQFLAAILPALAVVSAAGRRRGALSWRGTMVGLAYGGCGATTIALVLEGTVGLVLLIAILSSPGAESLVAGLQDLMLDLQRGGMTLEDLDLTTFLTPALVGAAFALVGLTGPLFEELAKAVGVLLASPRNRGAAWLWGVTLGAGFGVAEALTFGAMAVGLPEWPVNMVVRAITTLMHATMGGLAGMGVYELTAGRRSRGLGLLGLAWIGHAAWNSAVLASTLGGLAALDGPAWSQAVAVLGGLWITMLFAGMTLTFTALSRAAARVAPEAEGAPEPHPTPPGIADASEPTGPREEQAAPDAAESVAVAGTPGSDTTDGEVVADEALAPDRPAPQRDRPEPEDDEDGIPGLGPEVTWRPPPSEES